LTYIIIRRSEREIRERAAESAPREYRNSVSGYARDVEEADRIQRGRGRDNPNYAPILCDDGGKAERELRHRTLKSFGITNVEAFE